MGIDPKFGRYCDECGHGIDKAHRIYKGNEYCGSCYARVFVSTPCVECGKNARIHRHSEAPAHCRQCVIKDRVCVRCAKPVLKAGMLTEHGNPVCPSCVPYFLTKQRCPGCGEMASRLSRAMRYGIDEKICNKCRDRLTHKSCSRCGKYRAVMGYTEHEKPLCQHCLPDVQANHSCPGCGKIMPGLGKAQCTACLNWARLSKEVSLYRLSFEQEWVGELLEYFFRWLHQKNPDDPDLISDFLRNEPLFCDLDRKFIHAEDISEKSLLLQFSVLYLRSHLLASSFLQHHFGFALSEESKLEAAEIERVKKKIEENRQKAWGPLFEEYAGRLFSLKKNIRTIRLYLRAVEKFCTYAELGETPFSNSDILKFLRVHGGSKDSLHPFVTFCRDVKQWEVAMPSDRIVKKQRIPANVKKVKALSEYMIKIRRQGEDKANPALLKQALALAYAIPVKHLNSHRCQLSSSGALLEIIYQDERISVPDELLWITKRVLGIPAE